MSRQSHILVQRGLTLMEILVAVAIFGMVVAGIMRFGDFVSRRLFLIRDSTERMDQMAMFLKSVSADVRDGRQILYTSPTELGVWRADENGDSAPEPSETVGYAWDGESPGRVYRQAGENRSVILSNVRDLKIRYDRESPLTRHVMLEVAVGKFETDIQIYHFSLSLRAGELLR